MEKIKMENKTEEPKKECGTCQGYGMWAIGRYTSMGRGDSNLYPTLPYPECGADANPMKYSGSEEEIIKEGK